jgi:hypothetical protein
MSPKEPTALRVDVALMQAMRDLRDLKGVPVTAQIEMAVREWLKREHGITVKADRSRVTTRKHHDRRASERAGDSAYRVAPAAPLRGC